MISWYTLQVERHSGLELEGSYKFNKQLRLDLGASFGDWIYTDNVIGTSRDANGEPRSAEDTYCKRLYVVMLLKIK